MNALLVGLVSSALIAAMPSSKKTEVPNVRALRKDIARFAPVDLKVDLSSLDATQKQVLAELIEAAEVMDAVFLRQAWGKNDTLSLQLAQDHSALGRARLHYFILNKGPWSRLDHNAPFLPGVPSLPEAANFYPPDATKKEVADWIDTLSPAMQQQARGFYALIRRGTDGKFQLVPYSVAYQGALAHAAQLLDEAAKLTKNASLKTFLTARAEAFRDNTYGPSEVDWLKLDAKIDPTIGPYEVYNDLWFNAKAAFEAFINVEDAKETAKLQHLSSHLQDIENHLPIPDAMKNPKLGALAPIRVVNEVYCAGDANKGVQTAAYNLPNDARITEEYGTKRVMLKNIQEAKFQKVLVPISRIALLPKDRRHVSFDAFFTHILMHELMHGLGPHQITVKGKKTNVRAQLQSAYSAIEEAKADISGLFAMQFLIDQGVLDKKLEKSMYDTYLASAFRSIRFGTNEAHGKGIAVQLNFLIDHGGLKFDHGRLTVVPGKIKGAVRDLTHTFMVLEGTGDREGAQKLLDTLGVVRPRIQKILGRLKSVPVDIEPRFVTAERLLAAHGALSH